MTMNVPAEIQPMCQTTEGRNVILKTVEMDTDIHVIIIEMNACVVRMKIDIVICFIFNICNDYSINESATTE